MDLTIGLSKIAELIKESQGIEALPFFINKPDTVTKWGLSGPYKAVKHWGPIRGTYYEKVKEKSPFSEAVKSLTGVALSGAAAYGLKRMKEMKPPQAKQTSPDTLKVKPEAKPIKQPKKAGF